jgi:hypothetical protein
MSWKSTGQISLPNFFYLNRRNLGHWAPGQAYDSIGLAGGGGGELSDAEEKELDLDYSASRPVSGPVSHETMRRVSSILFICKNACVFSLSHLSSLKFQEI